MGKTVELYKICLNKEQHSGPELISLRQNYMYRAIIVYINFISTIFKRTAIYSNYWIEESAIHLGPLRYAQFFLSYESRILSSMPCAGQFEVMKGYLFSNHYSNRSWHPLSIFAILAIFWGTSRFGYFISLRRSVKSSAIFSSSAN